ncbi:MAG: flavodoxin [Deltaproteobacteria bacterium]|jgi:flavodoxin|nr:flavodoxin [Deltaproteobacteria bacterium]
MPEFRSVARAAARAQALALAAAALLLCQPAASAQPSGAPPAAPAPDAAAPSPGTGNGILVAYFSHEGHTKALAEIIHAAVGGDIYEIRTEKAYPADHDQAVTVGKEEQAAQARPSLAGNMPDMSKYRTVILGYPIWWGDPPMGVYTFVENNDFSGKTVAPFCTHGGSGLSRSVESLQSKLPGAKVLPGLAVRSGSAASSGDDAREWLQESGIAVRADG